MNLTVRFDELRKLIDQIREISGVPSLSLGVLHHGDAIHYASFGYRDVKLGLKPDKDTIYVIASMSKAITSAMTGILVNRGDLKWDTKIRDVLPDYQRDKEDCAHDATISDMLSHRAGVLSPDGYWMLSEGKVAFKRNDFVRVFNSLPTVKPIRTAYIYNNYAYELMGQVVEKKSGREFGDFYRETVMKPLGMKRTFDTRIPPDTENVAKPYAILLDRTKYELDIPLERQDGLFSSAGGMRSSVSDLLKFYGGLMDAGLSQFGEDNQRIPKNPLKELKAIWTGMISLPFTHLKENTYALGWERVQLPSVLGTDGPKPWKPVVGKKTPGRLILSHRGGIQGFGSFVVIVPETRTAVVVLINGAGLYNDIPALVAAAVLNTLLGEKVDHDAYRGFAKIDRQEASLRQSRIMDQIKAGQTVSAPVRPVTSYTGRFFNSLRNYFIDIRKTSDGELTISFMGNPADTFPLVAYQEDSFYWPLYHDKCVSIGRLTEFPVDYYIIKFKFDEHNHIMAEKAKPILYWKYHPGYPGEGERFKLSEH